MADANYTLEVDVIKVGTSLGLIIPKPYVEVYGIGLRDKLRIPLDKVKIIKATNDAKKKKG